MKLPPVPCVECGDPVQVDTAYGETDDYLPDGTGPYCTECKRVFFCARCEGSGEVRTWREYLDTCPACKGSGRKREE